MQRVSSARRLPKSNWLYSSDFLYNYNSVLLSNSSLYQSASCQIDRVKLDLCSSIKLWSSAAVRNDFAVFMFSSFLWSSQIVSHVQTKLKVGAFVAWTRIALCFEEKVCKPQSPPHPPFWKVRFLVWYARNRSDTWKISDRQSNIKVKAIARSDWCIFCISPPRSLVV